MRRILTGFQRQGSGRKDGVKAFWEENSPRPGCEGAGLVWDILGSLG